MKRPFDDLIRYMRAVVVTGIDMVYTGVHGLTKNGNCGVNIAWWSPHLRTGELHCTIPMRFTVIDVAGR